MKVLYGDLISASEQTVLQEGSEDLFIFKVRSFCCSVDYCQGKAVGPDHEYVVAPSACSVNSQPAPSYHFIHSRFCTTVDTCLSFGFVAPWRPEGLKQWLQWILANLSHLKTCLKLLNAFSPLKVNVYSLNSLLGFN